jgi:hypothetical protein
MLVRVRACAEQNNRTSQSTQVESAIRMVQRAHDMVCIAKGVDVTVPTEVCVWRSISSAIWRGLRTWARMPPKFVKNFTPD